jgi:hypothetical protein
MRWEHPIHKLAVVACVVRPPLLYVVVGGACSGRSAIGYVRDRDLLFIRSAHTACLLAAISNMPR